MQNMLDYAALNRAQLTKTMKQPKSRSGSLRGFFIGVIIGTVLFIGAIKVWYHYHPPGTQLLFRW